MQLYAPTSTTATRKRTRAHALAKLDGALVYWYENLVIWGCTVVKLASKKNASAPAPANTLTTVAPDVDFLITGLGD